MADEDSASERVLDFDPQSDEALLLGRLDHAFGKGGEPGGHLHESLPESFVLQLPDDPLPCLGLASSSSLAVASAANGGNVTK